MKKILLVMLAAFMLVACNKNEGGDTDDGKIVVPPGQSTNQTVHADNTEGSNGVSFTTAGAWTSSITEAASSASAIVMSAKAGAPDWVSITPSSGDKAGIYTISISLSPNLSGNDRRASITIKCGDSEITINVSQKGTKQDGTKPVMNLEWSGLDDDDEICLDESEGYTQAPVRTVIIFNKGNLPSGELTLALQEDTKNAFVLSAASLVSIKPDSAAAFTVSPKLGLKAGEGNSPDNKTYQAKVIVKNGSVNKAIPVYFDLAPAATASISVSDEVLEWAATEGYIATEEAETITVTNTGMVPTGDINLTFEQDGGENYFTVSPAKITSMPVGGNAAFTITPKPGLKAGEGNVQGGDVYRAKIYAKNKDIEVEISVYFTVAERSVLPPTEDEGVVINGVRWATRNVDASGTFAAAPESSGRFYRWGRGNEWMPDSGIVWDTWNNANPFCEDETWYTYNDPSPAGWRLPTNVELNSLCSTSKVTSEWTSLNGVEGRRFTDNDTGESIFMPAARACSNEDGSLGTAVSGNYWSSTGVNVSPPFAPVNAVGLLFSSSRTRVDYVGRIYIFSIRPVAE